VVSMHIGAWVHRLGSVWIEGEVADLSRRPQGLQFLTLRDRSAGMSLRVTASSAVLARVDPPIEPGSAVVVLARPQWYAPTGMLSLAASDVRPVGVGLLLARIEQIRRLLAAEGLFDPARKRPLPVIPRAVGLVAAAGSDAERDVRTHIELRMPGMAVIMEAASVQGPHAVRSIVAALRRLDSRDDVDVIVIARGGGSTEDLLPFSDELLVRAVAASRRPVVSAIGHEADTPLVDLAADVRASTPTHAGKLVVPDVHAERHHIAQARARLSVGVARLVSDQANQVAALRSRPALARPSDLVLGARRDEVHRHRERLHARILQGIDHAARDTAMVRSQLRALSPQATLDRGFAIVQRPNGAVVRDAAEITTGGHLRVRLARGGLDVTVDERRVRTPSADATEVDEERSAHV